ncbi:hypothetical protein SAMN05216404_106153 [Nitrosospira multiformis]|uniref:Uncharacterized protein n=1 Tax=Nitrosospira multiformis TaxID=1231 RepID=A0A1H8IRD0_9PROT|nr:hypothetical protein [Nitrosospira multiformis]SEN70941.1 hypothetical protein SAMN05216404_106153 [Nitrosospira multiformis]
MTHARQQIREAVAAVLSRNPVPWKTVTKTRIPATMQIWPYLMVFAESESSSQLTVNDPCVYEREVTITVAGMLKLPTNTSIIEDKMDECAAEIEQKLTQSTLRNELQQIQSLTLISTSMEVVQEEDGIDHGEVITSWRISYSTLEGSPDTLI